jgi:O-antigen/teichoic acid export membrane protein
MTVLLPSPPHQPQGEQRPPGTSGAGASTGAESGGSESLTSTRAGPDTSDLTTLAIGERAIANTLFRSGGELIGRLASLLLFAETARTVGQSGLGAFVFAVAYTGFVMVVADLGVDRYLLRAIVIERSASSMFFNILSLKLVIALPLFGAGLLVLHLAGYSHLAQATALALMPGIFSDSVARTQLAVFLAHERGGPPSLADAIQRVCSAALGIAALKAGYGVVAVAVSYSAGSAIGVLIGFVLLARTVGVPARPVERRRWRAIARESIPFASQDVFAVLLARLDALLLSVIATQAIVGRYGAAYRLFESTLLLTYALSGAFSAMYTYLGHDTSPSLSFMFQRSVKLALALLMPVAVVLTVLAGPICRLIYGDAFASSATPLRILAPAVVLLGLVSLTTSLMLSREKPQRMVRVTALIVFVNLVLNLILIPLYNDAGAAIAMLASELLFTVWTMRMAYTAVGGMEWLPTVAGTLAGGACMALAMALLLHLSVPLAVASGVLAYVLALLAVERRVSPGDVELVARMLHRRRVPPRPVG